MKHLLKKLVRPFWRMSAPLRRPLIRRFDHHMTQLIQPRTAPPTAPADLDLALNTIVRELGRIQMHVEILQQQIEELHSSGRVGARPENRLSVVEAIG